MRNSASLLLVIVAVTLGNVRMVRAEITSFAGFPAIHYDRFGYPSFDGLPTSAFADVALRPKWTRAMADVGAWPTMFEFDNSIYLEFNLVNGHRGTNLAYGATGELMRYRSSDQGSTWERLGGNVGGVLGAGEYVVKDDTLYRYEWIAADKRTAVSTSTDGVNFTPTQTAYQSPYWLYGAMYDSASDKFYAPPHYLPSTADESQRQVQLIQSDNGLDWNYVSTIHGPGGGESETVMHIRDDGSMVALVREKYGPRDYFMATSPAAPYTDWTSTRVDLSLEGHHFFEVEGQLFLGSRAFLDPALATPELIAQATAIGYGLAYTMIYKVGPNFELIPWAALDSMGDNSYPRAVVTDDEVLITYYSQHEDRIDKTFLAAFDKDAFLAGNLLVPEPSSYVLAATGLAALALLARRRRVRSGV